MKFKIVYFAISLLLISSCYKDLGNYNYVDINEVTFTGIASSYNVMKDIDTLKINPVINMTDGDINDESRFQYIWLAVKAYATKDTIGKTRNLAYPVKLNPDTYEFYLKVVDKKTDIVWTAKSSLVIGTAYTKGIMLIGENKESKTQVQMLAMVKDTVLFPDMLKDNGLPDMTGPLDIIHTGYNSNDKYIKLWVLSTSGSYFIDRLTQKATIANNFKSLTYMATPVSEALNPIEIVPRIKDKAGNSGGNSYRVVVCSNGWIFMTYLLLNGGDYYTEPINREESNYNLILKAKPYIFYGLNTWNNFVWYDQTNERFMRVASSIATTSVVIPDAPGEIFPWNQSGTGRTLVYGENTLNTDGGATGGISFAIMKDGAGNAFIYKFYASTGVEKRGFYQVKSIAPGFANAKFYAFSSKRTVVFYVYNNTLYAYDYNTGNEKIYTLLSGGDEITMLKADTQMEPSTNPIYIATYNATTGGTLQKYSVGTNPDVVTITADPKAKWSGLVKLKNMSWRAAK
jgi:hypothetical protein